MMRPQEQLVSLIMPVWRPHPAWFAEAVSSALAQEECTLELVIVDDGCAESIGRLVAPLNDPRVRLVRIEHSGQAAALNAGIAAAKGTWFRFIDADDVLPPASTTRLLELAEGEDVVTYGSTVVCDETLEPRKVIASTVTGPAVIECLLGRFHTRHPSMLFSRRVVEAAGAWDPGFQVSADWDFVLRALEHATVCRYDGVATLYRRHANSVSGKASVAVGEASRRRMIDKYFDRHPDERGTLLERQAWSALHVDRARAYWSSRYYGASLARFARAMRVQPLSGAGETARFIGSRLGRIAARAGWRWRTDPRSGGGVRAAPHVS